MTDARVTAVCVVHGIIPKGDGFPNATAIDKRPVTGGSTVGPLGIEGDTQVVRKYHGGPFQAVYAYADEDVDWWSEELGREIEPGLFGENLRTSGVDVTGAEIGERWQVGEPGAGPLLEVTSPREPCATFAARMREPRWVKRFTLVNRPGAYLRVVETGTVEAGDPLTVVHRPGHGVTIRDFLGGAKSEPMRELLRFADDNGVELSAPVRKVAARAVRRG